MDDDLLDISSRSRRKRSLPQSSNVLYAGIASIVTSLLTFWSVIVAAIGLYIAIGRFKEYRQNTEKYFSKSYNTVIIGFVLCIIGIILGVVFTVTRTSILGTLV